MCNYSIFQYLYFLGGPNSTVVLQLSAGFIFQGGQKNSLLHTRPAAQQSSSIIVTGAHSRGKSGRNVALTTHPLPAPWLKISTAVPASPSVPELERDGLNFMCVCFMTVWAGDVQSLPVQAADRSGSEFWTYIFWKGHFQILKFNLSITYFFKKTDIFIL